jgi:HEAT repeat protein
MLLEAWNSNDRFIRRAAFRLALESTDPDLPELLRQALGDDDTVVRLLAAKRVSSAFEGAALDQILPMMKLDRFLPVRREALRICVNRDPEQCRAELSSALLDKHASMRQEARYYLRQVDSPDFASLYRKALSAGDERTLYSALSGLGETGSAEDDVFIVPHTSHSTARIRRAAIKALARLNGEAHLDVLIEALTDEVPSVSREALKGLASHASLVGNERLWEILCVTSHGHVRRNALSLLRRLGKWDSIYFMVKATSASDEEVAAKARLSIERWLLRFNRTFYTPTPEQVIKIMNVLKDSGSHLDDKTRQDLGFCIKGF